MSTNQVVPEDGNRPGYDVLNGRIGNRTHCIHIAMATQPVPRTAADIGAHAKEFAKQSGMIFNERTFAADTTTNHLRTQSGSDRGYTEKFGAKWQLTEKAWLRIRRLPSVPTGSSKVNPRSGDTNGELIRPSIQQLREVEELEDHFASVKVRKYQGIFRENAIVNFDGRCCISGMLDRKLLVASHIVPWAQDRTIRLDPGNALLLYAEYDKLFDQYYFTVENDLRIRVVSWYKECGKPVRDTLGRIDGQIIHDGIERKINREYLKRHREKFALHLPSTKWEELH